MMKVLNGKKNGIEQISISFQNNQRFEFGNLHLLQEKNINR
jgi:hypothetical protein